MPPVTSTCAASKLVNIAASNRAVNPSLLPSRVNFKFEPDTWVAPSPVHPTIKKKTYRKHMFSSFSQAVKASQLKFDALLERSRCRGVGERQQKIRHNTSNRTIEALSFRLLLNQRHTIKDVRVALCCSRNVERFLAERAAAHEGDKLVFRKTSLSPWYCTGHTYRIQERELFSRIANSSCTEHRTVSKN